MTIPLLFYKNISLFFIAAKWSSTIDITRRHIFRESVKDFQDLHYTFRFTPYLLNPCRDTYFRTFLLRTSQPGGHRLWWPLLSWVFESLRICLIAGLPCHYIIFWMPTHNSSGSQFTWFISAVPFFVHTWNILFWNPRTNRSVKVNM